MGRGAPVLLTGMALAFFAWGGAGVAHAQAVVDLPGEDRPLAADFPEVYRVGSLDGAAWETFGDITDVAFDGDGNLYIVDAQASLVTVVAPDGSFLREVGGPGDGPGELRMPVAFTVWRDGRVVLADLGHRAYQIFGPDGSFQRMVAMGDGGAIRIGDLSPHPDGISVVSGGGQRALVTMRGPGSTVSSSDPETRPVERIDLSGERAEATTLGAGWQPPREDEPQTLGGGGVTFRLTTAGPRTFEPPLLADVLPDGGVAFSDSTTYAIEIVDANGEPVRVLRRPFEPRPVTESMERAERERRLAELEDGGGPQIRLMTSSGGGSPRAVSGDAVREMMRTRIEEMRFYPELSVLRDLATSWNGRIWVQRRGAEPAEAGPIDVLTPEGRYAGTLQPAQTALPDAFGPDGLAAFIELDAFDVPTVVVRRLPPVLN